MRDMESCKPSSMRRLARIWGSFLFVSNPPVERPSRMGDFVDASTRGRPRLLIFEVHGWERLVLQKEQ